jgi:hypothetical protein
VSLRNSGTESSYDGLVIATGGSQDNILDPVCYDGLLSVSPCKTDSTMQQAVTLLKGTGAKASEGKRGEQEDRQGSPADMVGLLEVDSGYAVKATVKDSSEPPQQPGSPTWRRTDTTTTTSSTSASSGGGGSESDACDHRWVPLSCTSGSHSHALLCGPLSTLPGQCAHP